MDSGKSDGEDSQSDGEEAAFQLWDTKRKITSYLMSSMKADADLMVVLVFSEDNTCYMRSDLSRFDLLVECRKSVPETAHTGGTPLHLGHTHGAMLQLRDIRALQDVQRPSFMVRIGAILVSIEPLNAIITRDHHEHEREVKPRDPKATSGHQARQAKVITRGHRKDIVIKNK